MDAELALSGCSETQPVILLVHQPNAASKILRSTKKRIDLILSGQYQKKGQEKIRRREIFPMCINYW